jgi:MFS family permease
LGKGVILAISLASFFTYYDISNYAYISPSIKEAWNLEDSDIVLGASVTVLGYVIGSIGITAYADRYGRKPALIISILVLAIGSIFSSLSQNVTQMVLFD